jgi:hypothetical protein
MVIFNVNVYDDVHVYVNDDDFFSVHGFVLFVNFICVMGFFISVIYGFFSGVRYVKHVFLNYFIFNEVVKIRIIEAFDVRSVVFLNDG